MALIMAFFGVLLFGALVMEGTLRDGNWFVLLAFGWIPVVGVPLFVVQAIRAVRRERDDAGVSRHGWFDVLHDRGLIPVDQLVALRTDEDGIEVQLRTGTLRYPPLEDTYSCSRRAARDLEVPYEMNRRNS